MVQGHLGSFVHFQIGHHDVLPIRSTNAAAGYDLKRRNVFDVNKGHLKVAFRNWPAVKLLAEAPDHTTPHDCIPYGFDQVEYDLWDTNGRPSHLHLFVRVRLLDFKDAATFELPQVTEKFLLAPDQQSERFVGCLVG